MKIFISTVILVICLVSFLDANPMGLRTEKFNATNNSIVDGSDDKAQLCLSCIHDPFNKIKSNESDKLLCNSTKDIILMKDLVQCAADEICSNSTASMGLAEGIIIYGCRKRQQSFLNECHWENQTLEDGTILSSVWTCYCAGDICNVENQPQVEIPLEIEPRDIAVPTEEELWVEPLTTNDANDLIWIKYLMVSVPLTLTLYLYYW